MVMQASIKEEEERQEKVKVEEKKMEEIVHKVCAVGKQGKQEYAWRHAKGLDCVSFITLANPNVCDNF